MQPQQPQGSEGPISFDMIMQLRNAARGGRSSGNATNEGAAQRRLTQNQNSLNGEEGGEQLANGQTPDQMVITDMQQQMEAEVEPPELTRNAATMMMRYGTIMDYLMRARGEMPDG